MRSAVAAKNSRVLRMVKTPLLVRAEVNPVSMDLVPDSYSNTS
jgi:hypothetical protein